jgi:tetratricopeptide (TPR) repeat protein
MSNTRLEAFRAMVAKNPGNALAHFGLANEASKENLLEEALEHYRTYLGTYDDEGNGYQRLADVLERLGRTVQAREAVQTGIAAARRFGHAGMANELEAKLEELMEP